MAAAGRITFMKNTIIAPALLVLLTLAFLVAPSLTPPFMGYRPGQMPVDIGRAAIQPAGYAFAIWGMIYLWLIAHAVFGLIWRREDPVWARPRLPLMLAVALGTVWLAIASNWPVAATISIAVMAIAAITAFLRADPVKDRWLLIAPLAIFAGWLTAATLVSLGVVLAGYGLLTNEGSAYVMLALATALGLALQSRQPSMPIYGATLVWALIAVNRVNAADLEPVALAAAAAAALIGAGSALLWLRNR